MTLNSEWRQLSFARPFRFLSDYDEQFPVVDDISLLQQAVPVMYPYHFYSTDSVLCLKYQTIQTKGTVEYDSAAFFQM